MRLVPTEKGRVKIGEGDGGGNKTWREDKQQRGGIKIRVPRDWIKSTTLKEGLKDNPECGGKRNRIPAIWKGKKGK